ncbi:MAG: hypothetical protein QOJ00_2871, partial [Actinomycetota bacterium]
TPVLILSTTAPESAERPHVAELVKPVKRASLYNAILSLMTSSASATLATHAAKAPVSARPSNVADGAHRLLLAEDDSINQRVAVTMLNKLGYSVVVAHNGREAVELGARAQFSAVLMDCQMPELDGYEATRAIRQSETNGVHIPIIAMTAHSMTTDRTKCLNAGMDDYISKPVRPAELQAVLARWLPVAIG